MMEPMSTRVEKQLTYDAPLAEVSRMMVDQAFREEVLTQLRVVRGSVDVTDNVVTIEQVQAAHGVPHFIGRLVGDEICIIQRETWTSEDRAEVEVTIPGKPGHMTGTTTLVESGGRTVETVILDITVRLPLVGGKMEGFVRDMLLRALDKEHRAGAAWLAR